MNYKIKVEGGFTGIPRTYQGKIVLSSAEILKLLDSIESSSNELESFPDGMIYHIEISYKNEVYKVVYNDKTIPMVFRKILQGD